MILKQRLAGLVLALFIAAGAAPSALAGPVDPPLPSSGAVDRPAEPVRRVAEVPAGVGFDWGDAGIGAGTMLLAAALGGALVLSTRRVHA
jgi:hypothetical protein